MKVDTYSELYQKLGAVMQRDSIKSHYIAISTVFGGAVLAVCVSLLGQSDSLVLHPLIGLVILILLFGLSFSFQRINIHLRLSLAFLLGTLVNQVMLNSFDLTLGRLNATLFWHLPVLTLFFVGFYAFSRKNIDQVTEMLGNYLIAGAVICLHMIILFFMLRRTFGFGYENSMQVFVNYIVFCVFLAGLVAVIADKVIFRGIAFILGCYFLALILIK